MPASVPGHEPDPGVVHAVEQGHPGGHDLLGGDAGVRDHLLHVRWCFPVELGSEAAQRRAHRDAAGGQRPELLVGGMHVDEPGQPGGTARNEVGPVLDAVHADRDRLVDPGGGV